MTPTISLSSLTRRYSDAIALDDVSLDIEGAAITGLLGRNGAGKTTLMRISAAQEFATAGRVQVLGASPVENDSILRRIVLIREDQVFPDLKVRQVLRLASWFHPNWSPDLAEGLVAEHEIPTNRTVAALSRGMRTVLGNVIGLAARAEVTLFDEPYAGLDAAARQSFNDRLLADYTEHPRTVVLSTHLIDEVANLLERVVLIDHGRIVLDAAAADEIRGSATRVRGSTAAVERFVAGRPTWDRRTIGSQTSVVVSATFDYVRWRRMGVRVFVLAQIAVLLAVGLTADRFAAWPDIGRFFTDLSATGLTGVLAAVAAALLVGGYATIRRVAV
jgi:ABC-2 type transport system ATP-binding protein